MLLPRLIPATVRDVGTQLLWVWVFKEQLADTSADRAQLDSFMAFDMSAAVTLDVNLFPATVRDVGTQLPRPIAPDKQAAVMSSSRVLPAILRVLLTYSGWVCDVKEYSRFTTSERAYADKFALTAARICSPNLSQIESRSMSARSDFNAQLPSSCRWSMMYAYVQYADASIEDRTDPFNSKSFTVALFYTMIELFTSQCGSRYARSLVHFCIQCCMQTSQRISTLFNFFPMKLASFCLNDSSVCFSSTLLSGSYAFTWSPTRDMSSETTKPIQNLVIQSSKQGGLGKANKLQSFAKVYTTLPICMQMHLSFFTQQSHIAFASLLFSTSIHGHTTMLPSSSCCSATSSCLPLRFRPVDDKNAAKKYLNLSTVGSDIKSLGFYVPTVSIILDSFASIVLSSSANAINFFSSSFSQMPSSASFISCHAQIMSMKQFAFSNVCFTSLLPSAKSVQSSGASRPFSSSVLYICQVKSSYFLTQCFTYVSNTVTSWLALSGNFFGRSTFPAKSLNSSSFAMTLPTSSRFDRNQSQQAFTSGFCTISFKNPLKSKSREKNKSILSFSS